MNYREAVEIFHKKYEKFPEDEGYYHIMFYKNIVVYAPSEQEATAYIAFQQLLQKIIKTVVPVTIGFILLEGMVWLLFTPLIASLCTVLFIGCVTLVYNLIKNQAKKLMYMHNHVHIELT